MKYTLFIVLLLFCALNGFSAGAKTPAIVVQFVPRFNALPLTLGEQQYALNNGRDSVRIHTLKFYISGLSFYKNGHLVWAETNSFHLMDAESGRLTLFVAVPDQVNYDTFRFQLGIDSSTNAAGAQGGDLDATKGMYWAWQSGYINFKLEGTSPLCRARKNAFAFHLGGFTEGSYCLQAISMRAEAGEPINIAVEVADFLNAIDLSTEYTVMTPGSPAVVLAVKAASMFHVLSPK